MNEWWINPNGIKCMLFFARNSEHTEIQNEITGLHVLVSRYDLIERGWKPL